VIGQAGYEVVLLRHGETVGYDGDLGLTPLGERQAA
jgi:broad specificity phosphatase PhoE